MRFTAKDARGRKQTFNITEVRTLRPRLYRDDEDKKSEDISEIEERLDELEKRLNELEKSEEPEPSDEDEDEEELDEEEPSDDDDLGSDDEEVSDKGEDEEKVVDLGDSVNKKPLYPNNRLSSLRSVGAVVSKQSVNDSADEGEDEIAKAWAERLNK